MRRHAVHPDDLKEAMAAVAPEGADYGFDAVGYPATSATALRYTRSGGTTVMVGLPPTGLRLDLDPGEFLRREKFLTGTMYGSEDPAVALPILLEHVAAGRLELAPLLGRGVPPGGDRRGGPGEPRASCRTRAGRALRRLVRLTARGHLAVHGRLDESASTACS